MCVVIVLHADNKCRTVGWFYYNDDDTKNTINGNMNNDINDNCNNVLLIMPIIMKSRCRSSNSKIIIMIFNIYLNAYLQWNINNGYFKWYFSKDGHFMSKNSVDIKLRQPTDWLYIYLNVLHQQNCSWTSQPRERLVEFAGYITFGVLYMMQNNEPTTCQWAKY